MARLFMKMVHVIKEIGKQMDGMAGAINSSPTMKDLTKGNGPTIRSMGVVVGLILTRHFLKESGSMENASRDDLCPRMDRKSIQGNGKTNNDMVLVYNTLLVFVNMKGAGKMIFNMDRGGVSGSMEVTMTVNGNKVKEVGKERILPVLE
jgi:hypothetical protein